MNLVQGDEIIAEIADVIYSSPCLTIHATAEVISILIVRHLFFTPKLSVSCMRRLLIDEQNQTLINISMNFML